MSHQAIRLCLQGTGRIFDWLKIPVFQCSVYIDSGGSRGGAQQDSPPLLLGQTEAQKQNFLRLDPPSPMTGSR